MIASPAVCSADRDVGAGARRLIVGGHFHVIDDPELDGQRLGFQHQSEIVTLGSSVGALVQVRAGQASPG